MAAPRNLHVSASADPTLVHTPAGVTPDARLVDPNAPTITPGPDDLQQGVLDLALSAPHVLAEACAAAPHVRIGWLRSVYNIFHAFAIGSFVDELAVHPQYQGRGVGSYMLDQLQQIARVHGCTHLVLEVAQNNKDALKWYHKRKFFRLDAAYLCFTQFINTMKQEPQVQQLLPLSAAQLEQSAAEKAQYGWDYLYEPDAPTVIDELLTRYIEALVYQAVADNMASEQSARMVAMKAATENAGNLIGELKLVYNKTRQAAITTELSEIVSGAAAISG